TPDLPFHVDQGFRLALQFIPHPAMRAGLFREGPAAIPKDSQPIADLALLRLHKVPLLPQQLGLAVQRVPFLEEALELDLRLFELRNRLPPDQSSTGPRTMCSD